MRYKMKFGYVKRYKKHITLIVGSITFISLSYRLPIEAMELKMKYLGTYSTAARGGPSQVYVKGYTSKTSNSCTFGTGDTALTFKWENFIAPLSGQKLFRSKGVFIGNQKVLENVADVGGIYRITSDEGTVFYLCYGGIAGPSQVFYLIGLCQRSYYQAITIDDLSKYMQRNLSQLDYIGALRLQNAYVSGSEIVVPLGNKNGNEGAFHFPWDEAAQWFGIEYHAY